MSIISLLLLFIWPAVYGALVWFGESIMGLGAVGAGIYAFFNRLLIPTGLHHALNNVFWFNLANINDIGKFWGSADPASGAVIATGGFHPFGVYVTGIYQAGFFPIMMFGLPAGALAIYKNAKPENKKATGSLMLAGALAAFLTGVTEPLEFSFMFAAFPLYVVHALLTAISVFIAASFQWIAGFNFSAGFIDWFLSLKVPAAHMPWMLIVQGLVFAVIYYFVFDFMIKKFNMKTPGRGDDDNDDASSAAFDTATSSTGDKYADLAGKLYAALGGHDNITEIENCITRLRMGVVDSSKVDVDAIRKTGVPGVKVIDKKNVQIIVGTQVQAVADALSALYGKPVIGGARPCGRCHQADHGSARRDLRRQDPWRRIRRGSHVGSCGRPGGRQDYHGRPGQACSGHHHSRRSGSARAHRRGYCTARRIPVHDDGQRRPAGERRRRAGRRGLECGQVRWKAHRRDRRVHQPGQDR